MKTFISFILLISATLPLRAQLQKGQNFIGGGLAFYATDGRNSSEQNIKNDGLNLNLGFGHMRSDKLAITLGLNYSSNKNSGFNEVFTPLQLQPNGEYLYARAMAVTESSYSSLGISVGLSNFIPLRERLQMVINSTFNTTFRSNESSQQIIGQNKYSSGSKQQEWGLKFSPGLFYFLSPRFALSAYFGGLSLSVTPKSDTNGTNTISGAFSTQGVLGIGLNYFIK